MSCYSYCPECPHRDLHPSMRVQVRSTGPRPARVLLLGAGPGKREAQTCIPYSGLAGEELTHTYLAYARLRRDEIMISNSTKCWDGSDKTPSETRVRACAQWHLPKLLDETKPEVVVLLGGVAQRLIDPSSIKLKLEACHGIPRRGSILNHTWEGWIWPSYEPALGMRTTSRMTQLIEDFTRLGEWLRGEWTAPETKYPDTSDYLLVEDLDTLQYELTDVKERILAGIVRPVVACDSETHGDVGWSWQYSFEPWEAGRLIRANRPDLLREFQDFITEMDLSMILHNAGGDLDIGEKMGIVPRKFTDTMQSCYHQCSLPQGLKPAVYRLFGIVMNSWSETVWPSSIHVLGEWLRSALSLAQGNLQETTDHQLARGRCVDCGHQHSTGPCKHGHEKVKKDGSVVKPKRSAGPCYCTSTNITKIKREVKASATESVIKHILRYNGTEEEDDKDEEKKPYDPWKKIAQMRVEGLRGKVPEKCEWEYLEEELGPMPILGIGNCKIDDAVAYAIGDACGTGRLSDGLDKMCGDPRWQIDACDKDV